MIKKKKLVWNKWTQEEFLEELFFRNKAFKRGEFWVLGTYSTGVEPLSLENKFGECEMPPRDLLQNKKPNIRSAKNPDQYFKNMLLEKNKQYREGNFRLLDKYTGGRVTILIESEFGLVKINPSKLLQNHSPSIQSAVNKTAYFKRMLIKGNTLYAAGGFEVIGEYTTSKAPIRLKDGLGYHKMRPGKLLSNSIPTIKSAEDPTAYAILEFIKIHGEGMYLYHDFIFINALVKQNIWCPIHNAFFEQSYDKHKQGRGCPKCADEISAMGWANGCEKSKDAKPLLYIIEIKTKKEHFFKIGVTTKTVKHRFQVSYFPLEYQHYKIIREFEHSSCRVIAELEIVLLDLYKEFTYNPQVPFGGKTECFTQINLEEIDKVLKSIK